MRKEVLNLKIIKDNYLWGLKDGNIIKLKYQKQTEIITKINFNFRVNNCLPQGVWYSLKKNGFMCILLTYDLLNQNNLKFILKHSLFFIFYESSKIESQQFTHDMNFSSLNFLVIITNFQQLAIYPVYHLW